MELFPLEKFPEMKDYLSWAISLFFAAWAIYLKGHSNRVRVTDQHAAEIAMMRKEIIDLRLSQARQESPLIKQVQDLLSNALHHPDPSHQRQDLLLERLDQTILTSKEALELIDLLDDQIKNPETSKVEIEEAKALKAIMPLVIRGAAVTKNNEDLNSRKS